MTAAPSTSLRTEVRPPSLCHAPDSLWQRLMFWLLAPAPSRAAPPLNRLPGVRNEFTATLSDIASVDATLLRDRIGFSRSLRELWHLRTGGHTRGCFARRGATAAAIIANAIFRIISEIGMTGTIFVFDIAIIFRTLIGVFNHQRNRRAGGHLFAGRFIGEDARENFHFIRFAPLRRETRLARFEIGRAHV